MALERSDRLKQPPIVGRFYLVPAIRWKRNTLWGESPLQEQPGSLWWPVIGPKHDDTAFFQFPHQHYHIDARFLAAAHWRQTYGLQDTGGKMRTILASPLNSTSLPDGPPQPTMRRMRCSRSTVEYPKWMAQQPQVCALNEHYAGTQCAQGKRGWVCPHRLVALGSVTPIDGVVTCFLHGLRIDAETGICLGPMQRSVA